MRSLVWVYSYVFLYPTDFLRKGPPFPSVGYDDLEAPHILPRTDHYRITPSPGSLGDRYGKITR